MPHLQSKHILVGITGSIAAYKSAELVRKLREAGAIVRVAMTENAKRFITPLTMQAVSGFPVHEDLFDLKAEAAMGHIELARWADLILIAPATADFMARLAEGHAEDLLTTICLASKASIVIAPAMNQGMWNNLLTQENLKRLVAKQFHILGPGSGSQACGDVGMGRMMEPAEIVAKIGDFFKNDLLANLSVLITAGPTQEPIDPVRFITNASSGKMGYALAEAAKEAGAKVTLVSGPVKLKAPQDIQLISVTTAQEMYDAVMKNIAGCDIFVAVAAVSDYRSEKIAEQKMHKDAASMTLTFERNPDIVASVGKLKQKPFIVGFAAETERVLAQAKDKRKRKQMDMIIANRVSKDEGFGTDDNLVTVIDSQDQEIELPRASKSKLAREIISIIASQFKMRKEK